MANILCIGLKSPITLAKLTLWPLNSYHTCVVLWCRCVENLKNIGQKLLKLFSKDVKMLTESRNHGITDRLKTVYPPKTSFCGGYNNKQWTELSFLLAKTAFLSLEHIQSCMYV